MMRMQCFKTKIIFFIKIAAMVQKYKVPFFAHNSETELEVKECFETENAIYVHTNLIGPSKEEKIVEIETDPYIVIKMEFIDKNVVFQ